jgi:tRNA (guanine-N7-)-methyltransferase
MAGGAGTRAAVAGDGGTSVWPGEAPLVLDLGCGNGVFLAGLAAAHPGWHVLGIEKKEYRVRQASRRVRSLDNARVAHGEVTGVLSALPAASVARIYLLFSDPWPKRRHASRRLVQPAFASLVAARLSPDGSFFFASDSGEYGAWAESIFRAGGWRVGPWHPPADWPPTEFEQRFVSAGVPIRRFQATR